MEAHKHADPAGGAALAGHAHPKFLDHHYDTPAQQYHAGKLGMWLFLATEILMFSGLFCAYAVYRHLHPEIFERASQFLDWRLGALNTAVLICSSLTIALAVRCAQLNQRRATVALLGVTLLCGAIFMGVKGVEYHGKWKHHLLPGTHFKPETAHGEEHAASAPARPADASAAPVPAVPVAPAPGSEPRNDPYLGPAGSDGPRGLAAGWTPVKPAEEKLPEYTHIFFGIYFVMTGLHGIHVLVGMGVIVWVLMRARRGEFSSEYYTPVDLVGLYWHVVDIIWIYLFPLLYLIR